jgi:hypothetical protein
MENSDLPSGLALRCRVRKRQKIYDSAANVMNPARPASPRNRDGIFVAGNHISAGLQAMLANDHAVSRLLLNRNEQDP